MYPNLFARMAFKNRMSVAQLAMLMGLSRQQMSKKLNGSASITIKEARKIQSILGGTLDELFEIGTTEDKR